MTEVQTYSLLCLCALLAGVINSIAGGGTLLTFSALVGVVNPVLANATSTVALVPGSVAGAWGYRREVRECRRWIIFLAVPSLIGGGIGSLLVTRLEEKYFSAMVPWLILGAALLFLLQPAVSRFAGVGKPHTAPGLTTMAGVAFFQFLVALYGGYFGAGIGILMLSALGVMGLQDIHRMNAVKTFLAFLINGVAVAVFIIEQKVVWHYALSMAVAAILGGYFGARVARRLNPDLVRWVVILIGFSLAAYFFQQQWQGRSSQSSVEERDVEGADERAGFFRNRVSEQGCRPAC
jgi:uncharacterized membrane protein YfcA